ncbi:GntR family transcriptional regulator [Roseovarius pacificus]|uniref:GntR family transcriptional regulator n=1 Tax=Roseovarius pacificus TaxID=337701 RepID=UPI00093240CD|nr:GntR family transcriptional regulator [Roseovarius pacificus]
MDTIEQPKSLTEQTHDILLNAICSGEFAPGERLHQEEIAARLSVSRGVVAQKGEGFTSRIQCSSRKV